MTGYWEVLIRNYDAQKDRALVQDLERRCEVGPAERVVLFVDTMGDPICRIRNSPLHKMLVAKLGDELVGVIQGSIKLATIRKPPNEVAKVGYLLGLRVSPLHRRKGIGLKLVLKLEEWFMANDVDYAYMATDKDNEASVNLFMNKLRYVKFKTPTILVNPVTYRSSHVSSSIEVVKLKAEEAELLYRTFMASTELFPDDIGNILKNKLSLGTWVAYPKGESWCDNGKFPYSWAMVSVWNSGDLFTLRLEKAPLPYFIYTKSSSLMKKLFPNCLKLPDIIPDFFKPFGFYFMYGMHHEGPLSGKLVRELCKFVHEMATTNEDCKVIVTEIGGNEMIKLHIPHWKSLSCPEDLWCIKALKNEEMKTCDHLHELTEVSSPTSSVFVDPREV